MRAFDVWLLELEGKAEGTRRHYVSAFRRFLELPVAGGESGDSHRW